MPELPTGSGPNRSYRRSPSTTSAQRCTLGTKFESSADGFIGAVEFYDTVENVGPHTAWLWSSTGRLLATTTFVEDGVTGWKRAFFTQPVAVKAGQTYVVAYHAPGGLYATDVRGFQRSSVTNRALTASAGVYTYGPGMPTQTWERSNYYVDVLFSTDETQVGPGAPTTTLPTTLPAPPTALFRRPPCRRPPCRRPRRHRPPSTDHRPPTTMPPVTTAPPFRQPRPRPRLHRRSVGFRMRRIRVCLLGLR